MTIQPHHQCPSATATATARRRFAPIPIETTYERVRPSTSIKNPAAATTTVPASILMMPPIPTTVPTPDLTPLPSPSRGTTEHVEDPIANLEPAIKPCRRFAPQLIESTRRTRRAGDAGPATKPTDKTDITPYTNHIYQPHHIRLRKRDDEKDANPIIIAGKVWTSARTRRETEDVAFSDYLLRLAARDAERRLRESALAVFPNAVGAEPVAHFYYRDSEEEEEAAEVAAVITAMPRDPVTRGRRRKSSDLGWWHKQMQDHALAKAQQDTDKDTDMADCAVDDDFDEFDDEFDDDVDMAPPDPMWLTSARGSPSEDDDDDDIFIDMPHFQNHHHHHRALPQPPPPVNPFDGFRRFGVPVDPFRKIGPSPPMLGCEIKFRTCPSPQHTLSNGVVTHKMAAAPHHPDPSDDSRPGTSKGLWRGTCLRRSSKEGTTYVPEGAPAYVATPSEPLSPGDPFAAAFGSMLSSPTHTSPGGSGCGNNVPKDAYFLAQRARREARAAKEKKVREAFDDLFVTQVFNYLSLGYPPTARDFDEELSKITSVSIDELRSGDAERLAGRKTFDSEEHGVPENQRCARWKALREYVYEWGRQCPDLDSYRPVGWAMRERQRGKGV